MDRDRYDSESFRTLFDTMAATYGYVNLISSFGFTARWRQQTVEGLPLSDAMCMVDLMSGMGEVWRSLSKGCPVSANVVGVDLSPEMARRTPRECFFRPRSWLPMSSSGFADIIVSSFGLKTFNKDQQRLLAKKVAVMLKPGGVFTFVEISVPSFLPLRFVYLFYLNRFIPIIGRILLGDPECYRMLGAYTSAFGDSSYFAGCLRDAGLDAEPISHFAGCATGVRGRKPPAI